MPMSQPDKAQRDDNGQEEKPPGELVRSFYVRHILYPLFMLQVKLLPLFVDFCYLYIKNLQHDVQGVLMKPDYIEQVREALARE